MLNKELKDYLYLELSAIYNKSKPELKEKDIRERIEVFCMSLHCALDNDEVEKVESLKSSLEYEISDLLLLSKQNSFEKIKEKTIVLEGYLRLLCFYVDRVRL